MPSHELQFHLKQVYALITKIMNDHHTPINLTHYNVKKKKLDSFGSDYLTNYLREDMRNNPAMLEAAKRDRTEMDKHDDTNYRDIRPQEAYNRAQFGHNLPYLPYPLDYMAYPELVDWTREALVADANSRGLKNKTVKWGHQSFSTEWWPEDMWPWATVFNIAHISSKQPGKNYPGPGSPLEFFRTAVQNCLRVAAIDPGQHVDPQLKERNLRLRVAAKARKERENIPDDGQNNPDERQSSGSTDQSTPPLSREHSAATRPQDEPNEVIEEDNPNEVIDEDYEEPRDDDDDNHVQEDHEEATDSHEEEDGNNNSLSEDFDFDAYEGVPGKDTDNSKEIPTSPLSQPGHEYLTTSEEEEIQSQNVETSNLPVLADPLAVHDDEEGDVQDQDQQEEQNPAPVSRSRIYGARRRSPEDINAAIAAAAGGRGRGNVRGRGGSGAPRLPPGPSTVMTRSRSRRGRKD